jgi:hypothetical protein
MFFGFVSDRARRELNIHLVVTHWATAMSTFLPPLRELHSHDEKHK